VLFDLGETLLSFGRVNAAESFSKGARLSYDFLKACGQMLGSFRTYHLRNLVAIRLRYILSNITGKDFDSLELLKKINTKRGVNLDEKQWRNLAWLWYQPLSEKARVEPDIVRTLTSLRDMGLKLGILSNTFISADCLDRHLKLIGILDFFPVRLYSYQFAWKKPNTRLFTSAADRMALPPENIAFIGDRIDKDIKPAARVGMAAVLKAAYTNSGQDPPTGAWKIDRLSELPQLIEKINARAT